MTNLCRVIETGKYSDSLLCFNLHFDKISDSFQSIMLLEQSEGGLSEKVEKVKYNCLAPVERQVKSVFFPSLISLLSFISQTFSLKQIL